MSIICIDPGHGGPDTGAVVNNDDGGITEEKTLTLDLARSLATAFRDNTWQVSLTRIDDREVSIEHRSFRANRTGAVCFISFHCLNSKCTVLPEGISDTAEPLEPAAYIVYQGGHGLGFQAAQAVRTAWMSGLNIPEVGLVAAPRLDLLRWCSIPALIIVPGWLETPADVMRLSDSAFQERLAEAICRGLLTVFH